MGNKWTVEQLDAITERNCNLLVAAAAGAGKTAVLVERIIRKITDKDNPVDIDKLLVVTFTNAAATEMRERIGNALAEALDKEPSSANLQNQMALLDRASIMTLHSFCLEVVRSHFHALELDPLFRIADETEAALMRLDVLEQLFEERYENEDKDSLFFRLVESYGGGRDDNSLREIVMTLHRFTGSHPYPGQWLADQAEAYNTGASACLSSTPWAHVLLKGAAAELQGLSALLERAAAQASQAEGLEPYCGVLEADLEMLEGMLSVCTEALALYEASGSDADAAWDRLHIAFSSFEAARLPRCGKNADKAVQEAVKAARNTMKERIKKLYVSGFDASSAEIREDFSKLYPQLKYLSDMVSEYDAIYRQKKKDKGLLDFNDLEHYCLQVLLENGTPAAAAKELRERYEEILIDEYQDSNLIQELIISTISGNEDGRFNIFMVGDVKQSIYRFRQARPELFLSKYMTYHNEKGYEDRVIQLYKNFRSRREVINGVNFIFRQIMSSEVGELDYTEREYLNPGAEFAVPESKCITGGAVELHILDLLSQKNEIVPGEAEELDNDEDECEKESSRPDENEGSEGTGEEEESLDNIQHEARIVGSRIRSLVTHEPYGFNVYDKKMGRYRPAEYRDIVILMRATRNWGDVFTGELALMGIPAYADTGLGYFRTVEVETMLSLLKIIDNPLQDIPMLAVLRSPVGGFNTDDLADIRLSDRSVSIYEAMVKLTGLSNEGNKEQCTEPLCEGSNAQSKPADEGSNAQSKPADEGSNELSSEPVYEGDKSLSTEPTAELALLHKTRKFLTDLDRWRDASQFMPTDELVWKLLLETGYYSYAGALPGGVERQANLRMLFERARQFEETSYRGLFNFINFINKLRSGGGDMGSAKILGENDNVVRIMSIHKSKGLEFPVVIVAGCGKRFNMQDLNPAILLHQELGFGPDLVDLDNRTIIPSLPKFAIRQKLRLETLSEEMRILYVAFTRAREKLIITGSVRDHEKACASWCLKAAGGGEKLEPYDMMQASSYLDWIGPAAARHGSANVIRRASAANAGIKEVNDDDALLEVRLWGTGASKLEKGMPEAAETIINWLKDAKSNESGSLDVRNEKCAGQYTQIEEEAGQIIKALEWKYPYQVLSTVPAKISVTELKRRSMQETSDSTEPFIRPMLERPLFMEPEKDLSAAHKGTVMHFVMQHLDLEKLHKATGADLPVSEAASKESLLQEIRLQLSAMQEKELLTEAETRSVRPEAIAAFFGSAVGQHMIAMYKSVHRETAFTIEVKCSEVSKALADGKICDEMMLLQGVIDCWFETGDGLILLDYKTDYVPEGRSDIIKERYKVQLEYYTKALQKIAGKKVTARYLYLFYSGELLSC